MLVGVGLYVRIVIHNFLSHHIEEDTAAWKKQKFTLHENNFKVGIRKHRHAKSKDMLHQRTDTILVPSILSDMSNKNTCNRQHLCQTQVNVNNLEIQHAAQIKQFRIQLLFQLYLYIMMLLLFWDFLFVNKIDAHTSIGHMTCQIKDTIACSYQCPCLVIKYK